MRTWDHRVKGLAMRYMRRHATLSLEYRRNGPLSWDKRTQTFSAEMSDLRLHRLPGSVSVRNPETGGLVLFSNPSVTKDPEGEVLSWTYTGEKGLKLILFND